MGKTLTVKRGVNRNLKFSPMNHHKQSRSKYFQHHAVSEYPKVFWDSSKKGTYRRSSG